MVKLCVIYNKCSPYCIPSASVSTSFIFLILPSRWYAIILTILIAFATPSGYGLLRNGRYAVCWSKRQFLTTIVGPTVGVEVFWVDWNNALLFEAGGKEM